MATKHFWYSLKDEDGEPIPSQSVYIYKNGTTDELTIFNSSGIQLSQPLTTDSDGIFEFYVKDEWSSGYTASQKMTIDWGDGSIDNLDIFENIYSVDETSTNTDKNKLVSNQQAYNWETHRTTYINVTDAHGIYHVDVNDSSDSSTNKVVSNYIMNDLYSRLASAGTITISASGAVAVSFSVDVEGGAAPALTDSATPSSGDYYVDLTHGLDISYPLLSVWKKSNNKLVYPSTIESIDSNNIRVYINEDTETEMVVIG